MDNNGIKWHGFFVRNFPLDESPEIALLKGHLLIEMALNANIERACENPKYIDLDRMKFSGKVCWVRALSTKVMAEESWLWGAIRLLNDARNLLAHELDVDSINESISKFIDHVKQHDDICDDTESYSIGLAFLRVYWMLAPPDMEPPEQK